MRNKEQQKESYRQSLSDLINHLEREQQLTLETPHFLAAVRVIPMVVQAEQAEAKMQRDTEIEQIGMEVTLRYEREHDHQPQDVTTENMGYDVRSFGPVSWAIRYYIKVKARARAGHVALTKSEWFIAQRLGEDFYLYVMINAAGEYPDLYVVRNPAACLQPGEQHQVRYLVPLEAIVQTAGDAP
jgi:hypothetical protein